MSRGNRDLLSILIKFFPAWESLVSDIPAGDGKTTNLFLLCILYVHCTVLTSEQRKTFNWAALFVLVEPEGIDFASLCNPAPVFVKVYKAQEFIPRNRFRQPM